MRLWFPILSTLAILISGCATPLVPHYDQGNAKLQAGDFEAAYRFFEDPTKGHEQDVEQAMRVNPQLLVAGLRTFSPEALSASIQRYGRNQSYAIEVQRLKSFQRYASPEQFVKAAGNFETVFVGQAPSMATATPRAVSVEEAATYADRLAKEGGKQTTFVGIVIDAQIANESTTGSSIGAQLGGLYGQSAYLDSAKARDYKATSQVTAGVAGAVVGSLFDKAPEKKFRLNYYIRTLEGDVRQFETLTLSTSHLPIGACVEVSGASIGLVNLAKCGAAVQSPQVSPSSPLTANGSNTSVEEKLTELKLLYDKKLIDRDIYLERQRELLRK